MPENPYILANMTWPEVQEALKTAEVAIIPTGSNEQHGPHMTLNMDIATATAMASGMSAATSDNRMPTFMTLKLLENAYGLTCAQRSTSAAR